MVNHLTFPMKYRLLAGFILLTTVLMAQTNVGLVAYYPFDSDFADATGSTANAGIPEGGPTFACGARDSSLRLDGVDDQIVYLGPVIQEFDTEDFTVSFYFKSIGTGGTQYLLSKRSTDCSAERSFYVRYVPLTRTLNVFLGENQSKSISFVESINPNRCWNQVTIIRQSTRVRLYINGRLRQEQFTNSRLNILNDGALIVGNSDCLGANERGFSGLIDDFRVYFRALDEIEARELYIAPDNITNRDTLIFLGGSVPIELSETCGTSFSWSPAAEITPPNVPNPTITPTTPGRQAYVVSITDDISPCVATDTIRVNVVDPNTLDCETVFLPEAFTPNNDGINDTYGISNPFAIQELLSFEIFDRWGGRVFYTEDPFGRWDGSANGEPVNPGLMLYRIRHICNGEEQVATGSVTIMR